MADLALARNAYQLLTHDYPEGLTREQLALKLHTHDRAARDAVNACRYLAATKPRQDGKTFIIGFDPQELRYVAARDAAQARRIIGYQESRVLDINRALDAQRACYRRDYGTDYAANDQGALFGEGLA